MTRPPKGRGKKRQPVAVVTIRGASRMTPEGRAAVGEWLLREQVNLAQAGAEYGPVYRARYFAR